MADSANVDAVQAEEISIELGKFWASLGPDYEALGKLEGSLLTPPRRPLFLRQHSTTWKRSVTAIELRGVDRPLPFTMGRLLNRFELKSDRSLSLTRSVFPLKARQRRPVSERDGLKQCENGERCNRSRHEFAEVDKGTPRTPLREGKRTKLICPRSFAGLIPGTTVAIVSW